MKITVTLKKSDENMTVCQMSGDTIFAANQLIELRFLKNESATKTQKFEQ